MKKKNILIVGGMGFIGQHVTEFFRRKKFNIVVLDIKIPNKNRSKDVKYIKGSIENQKTVQRAMKKIDSRSSKEKYFGHINNFRPGS